MTRKSRRSSKQSVDWGIGWIDMRLFRNPELKRELWLYIAIAAACALIGFLVDQRCGVLALVMGILFCSVYCLFSQRRYHRMEELAQKLDRILHGQDQVLIEDQQEGELSILNSELQKMTLRLKEQTDLLTSDKLRLTEAIQDIFHQIRTPLTSMNLITSMLGDENLCYERRLEMTREIKRQLERVQWLVETLLKLSKIDAGTAQFQTEPISVAALIQKAAEPLQIPMELRGLTLITNVADEHLTGDFNWTVEAIVNILKNCMEHTPPGGSITVQCTETALFTELIISDTGSGFSKEDIPHLFDRFYRGKNASDDSIGIGLALSRSILTAQNGTIKAENASNGGARFVIRFYKSVI